MKMIVNDLLSEVDDSKIEKTNILGAKNCIGNACGSLTVTGIPGQGGIRFSNTSSKPIHVTVSFAFGLGCMSPSNFTVNPRSFSDWGNGAYCNAIQANF